MPNFKHAPYIKAEDIALSNPLQALTQASAAGLGIGLGASFILQLLILAPYIAVRRQRNKLRTNNYDDGKVYDNEIKL